MSQRKTRVKMTEGSRTGSKTSSRGGSRASVEEEVEEEYLPESVEELVRREVRRRLGESAGEGAGALRKNLRRKIPTIAYSKKGAALEYFPAAKLDDDDELLLFNPESGRYVKASGTVGTTLRKGPNFEVYAEAAEMLGKSVKAVRSRETAKSREGFEAYANITVRDPENPKKMITFGDNKFNQYFAKNSTARAQLIADIRKKDAKLAANLQAIHDSGKIGRWVQVSDDNKIRWIHVGGEAHLKLLSSDPSTAIEIISEDVPSYDDDEKSAVTKGKPKATPRKQKALSNVLILNPLFEPNETGGRQIKFGGETYIKALKNASPSERAKLARKGEKRYREQVRETLSGENVEQMIADVAAAVAAAVAMPAKSAGKAPSRVRAVHGVRRSRSPSPASRSASEAEEEEEAPVRRTSTVRSSPSPTRSSPSPTATQPTRRRTLRTRAPVGGASAAEMEEEE